MTEVKSFSSAFSANMAYFLWSLTLAGLFLAGFSSCQTPAPTQDDPVKYACTGEAVEFPWTAKVGAGDHIRDVHWGKVEGGGDHLIAWFSPGYFMPVPPYTPSRLTHKPSDPASLVVDDVTSADSGRYYVDIAGTHSDGSPLSDRHEITLQVVDSYLLSPIPEVKLNQVGVHDTAALEMTCGRFLYPGSSAPIDVIWTDPNGQVLNSTSYNNGTFHLLLSMPIADGTYTCALPAHGVTCGNGTMLQLTGSVVVSALLTRVALLEAQQGQLIQENAQWRDNITQALAENQSLKDRVTALQHKQLELIQQAANYSGQTQTLQTQNNATSESLIQLQQQIQQLESSTPNHTNNAELTLIQQQIQALNQSTEQCTMNNQQLESENLHLSEQNSQLLQRFDSIVQEYNATETENEVKMASLESSLNAVSERCSKLNESTMVWQGILMGMQRNNMQIEQRLTSLEQQVNSSVASCGSLNPQDTNTTMLSDLQRRVDQMTARYAQSDVSFHARMSKENDETHLMNNDRIILSHVINNRGGAYDPAIGKFHAPYNATYLFLATLASKGHGYLAQMYLMHNDQPTDFVSALGMSNHTSGAAHAVLHLTQGDSVWLKPLSECYFNATPTAFSGALLYLDG